MALQNTDYFSLNRGGNPGDGSSGTYYVAQLSELTSMLVNDLVPGIISANANNALVAGTDDKLYIKNVVIAQSSTTGDVTLTDNLGNDTTVDVTKWMSNGVAP